MLLDPASLKVAQEIYQHYRNINAEPVQRPSGVVIRRSSGRVQLIFSATPILLPDEYFVPFEEIESRIY